MKIVLKEINDAKGTDFQQKDVYFNFEREVMSNAQENAQIELTDAQKQQVEINTLLGLAQQLDDETLMQLICDILDIDYQSIKDKLPKEDDGGMADAQSALNGAVVDQDGE